MTTTFEAKVEYVAAHIAMGKSAADAADEAEGIFDGTYDPMAYEATDRLDDSHIASGLYGDIDSHECDDDGNEYDSEDVTEALRIYDPDWIAARRCNAATNRLLGLIEAMEPADTEARLRACVPEGSWPANLSVSPFEFAVEWLETKDSERAHDGPDGVGTSATWQSVRDRLKAADRVYLVTEQHGPPLWIEADHD